jgi:predicted membrane protein
MLSNPNKQSLVEKPIFFWISFPLVEFPFQSLFVFAFLVLAAVFVYTITYNFFWVLLALLFLFTSLFSYFVPTYYEFYEDYVFIKVLVFKRERKYSEFKCFYADKKGVMLSTFARPRALDRFRGQSIRFTKEQQEREEVLRFLDEKIGNRF